MPFATLEALVTMYDVCVVGAGPAGLICALTLHARGLRVLVLEAGGKTPLPGSPDILAARIKDTNAHGPTDIVAAAAFGGSSHWWGGRIIPLDPVDFRTWPITHQEMTPWFNRVSETLDCHNRLSREAPGAFSDLADFQAHTAESFVTERNLAHRWASRFRASDGPTLLLGARVVGMNRDGKRIDSLRVLHNGRHHEVKARRFVLAGGGLGTLRLMLTTQREHPDLFGGVDGPLGRGYMGHMTGSIADLKFDRISDASDFGFVASNSFVSRRRITPRSSTVANKDICNIAFWLEGPRNADPSHGSASSSARYLAASAVRLMAGKHRRGDTAALGPHIKLAAKAPLHAAYGLSQAAWALTLSRLGRQGYYPKRFASSGDNGWRMIYHAEQKPDPSNRISLTDEPDSIGMPKLNIDFRFSKADVDSVVRAHELLDTDLRATGAGSLRFRSSDPSASVHATARDGYHQLGGAIMSTHADDGVVDPNCDVHGLENLSIASACVFPSGGQANPTMTIMALACRLADRLADIAKAAPRQRAEACA